MLILNAQPSSYSVSGMVIWLIVAVLVLWGLKAIGRLTFGVSFFVAMAFFTIFLLDNYTLHDLRRYVDLSSYDETLADPQGKVEEIVGSAGDTGKELVGEVDEFGSSIDNTLGIERKENTKEWSTEEDTESEESKESEDSEKEESVPDTKVDGASLTLVYTDINKVLKYELKGLSAQDKSIIESMTPSVKLTLKGEQITVTNEDDGLEDNQLKITVNQ